MRSRWLLWGMMGACASVAVAPVIAQSVFQPSASVPSLPQQPMRTDLSRSNGPVFSPWSPAQPLRHPGSAAARVTVPSMGAAPSFPQPSAVMPAPARPQPSTTMPDWQWPEPDEGVAEGRRVNPWRPDASQERRPAQLEQKASTNATNSAARNDLDWLESNWQDYLERERQRAESTRQREEWLQELRTLQQRYPTSP